VASRPPSRKGSRSPSALAEWKRTFLDAVDELGPVAVGRIIRKPWNSVAKWASDPTTIPNSVKAYDIHLMTTVDRIRYMKKRSKKADVSERSRKNYFKRYIEIASRRNLSAKDNYEIVTILLNLKIDPHRPESYLRDI
jgi:hypothetical protein